MDYKVWQAILMKPLDQRADITKVGSLQRYCCTFIFMIVQISSSTTYWSPDASDMVDYVAESPIGTIVAAGTGFQSYSSGIMDSSIFVYLLVLT